MTVEKDLCPKCGDKRYMGYFITERTYYCGTVVYNDKSFDIGKHCLERQLKKMDGKIRRIKKKNKELEQQLEVFHGKS